MAKNRKIYFKRYLFRYYPVHIYGWLMFLSVIAASLLMFHFLNKLNYSYQLVDDFVVLFTCLLTGLVTLFLLVRKYS